ncbi:MAG: hypothetical protein P8189_22555 [Anaerolineae bacterium]
MTKKIVLSILLIGLIGTLVAGGVIRTLDKTGQAAEAQGLGRGHGNGESSESALGNGQGRGGNGQGGGYGQSGTVERQYANYEAPSGDWVTYEGTVVESPETGGELVVMTDGGQEVMVGTGPGYMEAQGFALTAGERVQVQGYWEDDELKAAQVTRLRDGETVALRDDLGRPAWSGAGRRAAEQQTSTAGGGQGQAGLVLGSDGAGAAGIGQADVDEWLTLTGTVVSVDSYALTVETTDGREIAMLGRPWLFARESGAVLQVGDQVQLLGFDEAGEFEVGQIANLTTGNSVVLRDESGRPLWAGGGRRGS